MNIHTIRMSRGYYKHASMGIDTNIITDENNGLQILEATFTVITYYKPSNEIVNQTTFMIMPDINETTVTENYDNWDQKCWRIVRNNREKIMDHIKQHTDVVNVARQHAGKIIRRYLDMFTIQANCDIYICKHSVGIELLSNILQEYNTHSLEYQYKSFFRKWHRLGMELTTEEYKQVETRKFDKSEYETLYEILDEISDKIIIQLDDNTKNNSYKYALVGAHMEWKNIHNVRFDYSDEYESAFSIWHYD